MNSKIMLKIAVILLLMSGLATAQDAPRAAMNAEEAVGYALEHNKELLADRKMVEEAAGKLKQAALRANPMLEVMGGSSVNDRSMNEVSAGVSLPLELGGRRAGRIAVAEKEVARQRLEVADRERRLAAEIRMKYAEAIEAGRTSDLIKRMLDLDFQSLTLLKARVDEGISPAVDLNMLRVEIGTLRNRGVAVESRRTVLLDELKNLLGIPQEESLELKDDLTPQQIANDPDRNLAVALSARPDLLSARSAEAVSEAMIEEAKTEGRFDISLFTEFGRQSWRFDQLGSNMETGALERVGMRNYVLKGGVSIMLPTRNRNQGNIEAAVAMNDRNRLRREFLETVVRREVKSAMTKYEASRLIIKTFDDGLLAAARDTLRILRASYDLGHTRITEVLDAQRRLIELQMGYIEAQRDHYAACVELRSAMGWIK